MEIIKDEIGRSGGQGPNSPYDFLSKLLASSKISESKDEEYDKLNKILKPSYTEGTDAETTANNSTRNLGTTATPAQVKEIYSGTLPLDPVKPANSPNPAVLEAAKEFYSKLPRFHKYAEFMTKNIFLFNDNIYVSKGYAHLLMPTLQISEELDSGATAAAQTSNTTQPATHKGQGSEVSLNVVGGGALVSASPPSIPLQAVRQGLPHGW